jgi:hypothetical protein
VERAPGAHWIGGWVDLRGCLDDMEERKFLNLPELELRPLGRPARSQSLYRLRYPASRNRVITDINFMPLYYAVSEKTEHMYIKIHVTGKLVER